jgi:hypothetical protein
MLAAAGTAAGRAAGLGRNFEAMDPLEWLARMADHIPDAGKHRDHFYGFYASRVRASRREREASDVPAEPAPAKRRCSPNWARLISKVYQADPLVCKGCGGPLKIVAYINDQTSIKRILDHLGLWPAGRGGTGADPGAGPCGGGRRGTGDPGRLRTTTLAIDAPSAKGVVSLVNAARAMSRRVGCISGAHESRHPHSRMPRGGVEWGWKLRSPPSRCLRSPCRG